LRDNQQEVLMSKRFLSLVVVVSLLAVPAFAKHRAVRAPGGLAAPQCFTFGFVTAGTVASYLSTTPGGNVTFTINYLSDTATQTHTTQSVTTPQATTQVETIVTGEVVGPLRSLKHVYTKSVTPVPIIGSSVIEVDIDFVPSLVAGPAIGWCENATWTVPPSTETIVSKSAFGQQQQIVTTAASEGQVLAVGEMLTVPGGTFETVKYRGALVSGTNVQTAITWVSMERNIVVRQDTLDTGGAVTTTTVLTALQ
jgi:hypothetical protein